MSILIFFQFYCKISRNQLEIVVEASWSTEILRFWNIENEILRKKPGDEAFRVSFKFPRRGWDQRLANFNRFSSVGTWSCYSCLVLYLHDITTSDRSALQNLISLFSSGSHLEALHWHTWPKFHVLLQQGETWHRQLSQLTWVAFRSFDLKSAGFFLVGI